MLKNISLGSAGNNQFKLCRKDCQCGLFGNVEKNYSEKLNFVKNCFHLLSWTNVKEQES